MSRGNRRSGLGWPKSVSDLREVANFPGGCRLAQPVDAFLRHRVTRVAEPATPQLASYFPFGKKMMNIMNWKDSAPAHIF